MKERGKEVRVGEKRRRKGKSGEREREVEIEIEKRTHQVNHIRIFINLVIITDNTKVKLALTHHSTNIHTQLMCCVLSK